MKTLSLRLYLQLVRPFTLLAPFIGFLSAAVMASRSLPPEKTYLGALSAMLLNAGSNGLNQIFDLEIDRINKPERPLPSSKMTVANAAIAAALLYVASLVIAAFVNRTFLVIVVFTAFLTYAYSAPPFRTKRSIWLANLTIAIPRGMLLIVAGWASVAKISTPEPWFAGMDLGLYLLGAASTKDFADADGDRKFGCKTLPVVLGVRKSVHIVAPFLSLPFILILVGTATDVLTGNPVVLVALSIGLVLWGAYAAYLLLRNPEALATERNHPSWKHMYLILLTAQLGLAAAYLL
ncbi:UbiA family prenyltransferase [bacterium]|nr:UbiA family prenyltransferase [bacterium]